jgi:tRNA (guanine-N7-)-methyltransferase
MSEPTRPLRTFGRIKARPIKPRQAALMTSLLPDIGLPDGPVDPLAIKPDAEAVWLEIGFGGGEHLAAQAARHPGALFIGAEPFLNGVASALRHVDEQGLTNARLVAGDGREVMSRLPDGCLARLIVLFPDPWPKTRHHKRRLVQADFLAEAARLLQPAGRFRFATDWADYADWTLEHAAREPRLRWLADRAADWKTAPADHVTTRYETKRLGDCDPIWLEYERV